jgi:hypothetical protein
VAAKGDLTCIVVHQFLKHNQVHTPKKEKRNPRFKAFKREVRHRAWELILEDLRVISTCGEAMTCGDLILRIIVFSIYILFMDFEEQYVLHQVSE